jgi:hypothetical protein
MHEAVNHIRSNDSESFAFGNDPTVFSKIIDFGKLVIDHLKTVYPAVLEFPILRLDIMQRLDKRENMGFVVNEFESLDALTTGKVSMLIRLALVKSLKLTFKSCYC